MVIQKEPKPIHRIATLLSLCVMPWVVFVSSTNSLFLANQADLNYSLSNYRPFFGAFVLAVAVGVTIFVAVRKKPRLAFLLWGFHLFAIAFQLFVATLTNETLEEHQALWLASIAAMFAGLVFLLRNKSPERATPFLAMLALLLIAADAYRFVTTYEFSVPDQLSASDSAAPEPRLDQTETSPVEGAKPNIYHILLDGFQSDMLRLVIEKEPLLEDALAGFTVFPGNVTPSGRTRVSIPAVFAGRSWNNSQPLSDFIAEAMSGPGSLLYQLKRSGYTTSAYLHRRFGFEPHLFDQVYFHHNAARHRDLGDDAFQDLWIYGFTPRVISTRLLEAETRTEIAHRSLSPIMYAVVSYDTFLSFLGRESALPASNRYTFVHLLLPHHPYVLDCQCTFQKAVEPIEQFCCAVRVVADFVGLLKELGRFDDALIVVQGDHGLNLVHGDGTTTEVPFDASGIGWNEPRSRAMLMLKPVGTSGGEPLRRSNAETSLIDIAPTVYRSLGIPPPPALDGGSLVPQPELPEPRTRYYEYFVSDREEEVYRFVVDGGPFRFDRIVRPTGFYSELPVVHANDVLEAEAGVGKRSTRAVIGTDYDGTSGQHVSDGSIFFRIAVEQPGSYRLSARVICDADGEGALHVSLDERPYDVWTVAPCTTWQWQAASVDWPLEPGEHVLIVRQGGGLVVDQFKLERVP